MLGEGTVVIMTCYSLAKGLCKPLFAAQDCILPIVGIVNVVASRPVMFANWFVIWAPPLEARTVLFDQDNAPESLSFSSKETRHQLATVWMKALCCCGGAAAEPNDFDAQPVEKETKAVIMATKKVRVRPATCSVRAMPDHMLTHPRVAFRSTSSTTVSTRRKIYFGAERAGQGLLCQATSAVQEFFPASMD